jgi:hypothetical protein
MEVVQQAQAARAMLEGQVEEVAQQHQVFSRQALRRRPVTTPTYVSTGKLFIHRDF